MTNWQSEESSSREFVGSAMQHRHAYTLPVLHLRIKETTTVLGIRTTNSPAKGVRNDFQIRVVHFVFEKRVQLRGHWRELAYYSIDRLLFVYNKNNYEAADWYGVWGLQGVLNGS
ncbi:uncharacterized protein MELLADRAFT_110360 [Melampsora larici-populina 98AG31]|uniref:Uncharacterized protein n=1 Tax=Melampsora larici-populina (strain 98AG31 / pathotype 3-4-7) TaxID=747676 RepID=F4RZI4_MELLP|nr:uncharacterized protein MELLADRAFT_110360 [Melampsora larici-populina 98AG31]EGG02233.1 hypothetical protein MELLADRAFT_110360 [Melampsora larici-populina 98AG31]